MRMPRKGIAAGTVVPVTMALSRATSETVRPIGAGVVIAYAIGKTTSSQVVTIHEAMVQPFRNTPAVEGRKPATPQNEPGRRAEPAVSLARPAGVIRAEMAAAVPPAPPPGTRVSS